MVRYCIRSSFPIKYNNSQCNYFARHSFRAFVKLSKICEDYFKFSHKIIHSKTNMYIMQRINTHTAKNVSRVSFFLFLLFLIRFNFRGNQNFRIDFRIYFAGTYFQEYERPGDFEGICFRALKKVCINMILTKCGHVFHFLCTFFHKWVDLIFVRHYFCDFDNIS